jgi:hypothetical protein
MTHPTADTIRSTYAARIATARRHTPFGVLTDLDRKAALKRTARACGVDLDTVKEAVDG